MGATKPRSSESKAERKFEKKLQFYSKVRETVASLTATKAISKKQKTRSRQKKLKRYDLSSLSEFLPDLPAPRQAKAASKRKLNCKSRQKIVIEEGNQLKAVLSHPDFKANPLAAIHQHLQSTQPPNEDKQKKKNGSKKSKEKRQKAASELQPMDI